MIPSKKISLGSDLEEEYLHVNLYDETTTKHVEEQAHEYYPKNLRRSKIFSKHQMSKGKENPKGKQIKIQELDNDTVLPSTKLSPPKYNICHT